MYHPILFRLSYGERINFTHFKIISNTRRYEIKFSNKYLEKFDKNWFRLFIFTLSL